MFTTMNCMAGWHNGTIAVWGKHGSMQSQMENCSGHGDKNNLKMVKLSHNILDIFTSLASWPIQSMSRNERLCFSVVFCLCHSSYIILLQGCVDYDGDDDDKDNNKNGEDNHKEDLKDDHIDDHTANHKDDKKTTKKLTAKKEKKKITYRGLFGVYHFFWES